MYVCMYVISSIHLLPYLQLPPELYEEGEEDEAVRVVVGVKRPVPLTQEDAQSRYRRYKR